MCEEHSKEYNLEKTILDCGAGGTMPPLGLFSDFGYQTTGIEFSDSQIKCAKEFEEEHGLKLNIQKGDMRALPFKDASMSFVYSHNSIFHMKKVDIDKSISELKRVLKPNGLILINLLTLNDCWYGDGKKVGDGEYLQEEHGGEVIHSYYSDEELKNVLGDMELLVRENRVLERVLDGELIRQGYCEIIAKKRV